MTLIWRCWSWHLGLASLLGMSGAIASLGNCALAQIIPDSTLGTESSVVAPNGISGIPIDQIDGGAKRGVNLFHSFREFNIDEGRGAYFTNPDGIANIFSRITGSNPSNILGTLGVRGGSANLFLINPNGIIFGPASSLDVSGSFVATTANAIGFAEQGFFSASAPDVLPVLTVNPSAFLFNQIAHGAIANSSTAPAGLSASGVNVRGLRVPDGQSLLLVGGDISIDGGRLNALGGRVELGGLSGLGNLGLEMNNTLRLSFPSESLLSNVTLANDARVGVRGLGGGDIVVNANAFTATDGGRLAAGTEGLGNGGDITVNANDFNISGVGPSELASGIYNQVFEDASGNAGNIFINTRSFSASSGALVSSSSSGTGDAGNVTVRADGSVSLINSYIFSVGSNFAADSKAGDINITARSLSMTDGSSLGASNDGQGGAGNVKVQTADSVSLDNDSKVSAFASGTGAGGNIFIGTGTLSIKNGSQLLASVSGEKRAGDLTINASESVELVGARTGLFINTFAAGDAGSLTINTGRLTVRDGAQVSTSTFDRGDGGKLVVNALESVEVIGTSPGGDFSTLETESVRTGAAGNISINTGRLTVQDGGKISASTSGSGLGGKLEVNASDSVEVTGSGVSGLGLPSDSALQTDTSRAGAAGDISITTSRLSVWDGGKVSASTSGSGRGGNLEVNASDSVEVTGREVSSIFVTDSSALQTDTSDTGAAGDIKIVSGRLSVQDEAKVSAATSDSGKGGSIQVQANSLSLANGGRITSSSDGQGDAGEIFLNLSGGLQADNGKISTNSAQSTGGRIDIVGSDIYLSNNSRVSSTVESQAVGKGGDINITAGDLALTDGSQVAANTLGSAEAGDITINSANSIGISGVGASGTNSSGVVTSTSGSGNGGNIIANTNTFKISDGGELNASTDNAGEGGKIIVNANTFEAASGGRLLAATSGSGRAGDVTLGNNNSIVNLVTLSGTNSGLFANTDANSTGDGGDISIVTTKLDLPDSAQISAQSQGVGEAGNVLVRADEAFSADNSKIITAAAQFAGGDITIQSPSVFLTNGAQLNAQTSGQGKAGNIEVTAADVVNISGVASGISTSTSGTGTGGNITVDTTSFSIADGGVLNAETSASGTGGSISVNANSFNVTNGGQLTASTSGSGNAGKINIQSSGSVSFDGVASNGASGAFSTARSGATGNSGDINVQAGPFSLTNGAEVSSRSQGSGTAGDITINASQTLTANNGEITTAAFQSTGGNLDITAQDIRLSGNSDITTNVTSGEGDGGNIYLKANSILAFGDSDILASAIAGRGGDIKLDTPIFLGSSYQPAPRATNPDTLNGNNRVDVNASGALAGVITLPDVSFLQNSLTQLPEILIDTNNLVANSCITRSNRQGGSFNITGAGGLPTRPGDASISPYPTGTVRSVLDNDASSSSFQTSSVPSTDKARPWKMGDPIVEPQGVYRLANGELVMSRECSH